MLTKNAHLFETAPDSKLLLSAASKAEPVQGQIRVTPSKITDKFMWTPPMPSVSMLGGQLAAAGVRLRNNAIKFVFQICGDHSGMGTGQRNQREQGRLCAMDGRTNGEVKLAWADENWSVPTAFWNGWQRFVQSASTDIVQI